MKSTTVTLVLGLTVTLTVGCGSSVGSNAQKASREAWSARLDDLAPQMRAFLGDHFRLEAMFTGGLAGARARAGAIARLQHARAIELATAFSRFPASTGAAAERANELLQRAFKLMARGYAAMADGVHANDPARIVSGDTQMRRGFALFQKAIPVAHAAGGYLPTGGLEQAAYQLVSEMTKLGPAMRRGEALGDQFFVKLKPAALARDPAGFARSAGQVAAVMDSVADGLQEIPSTGEARVDMIVAKDEEGYRLLAKAFHLYRRGIIANDVALLSKGDRVKDHGYREIDAANRDLLSLARGG